MEFKFVLVSEVVQSDVKKDKIVNIKIKIVSMNIMFEQFVGVLNIIIIDVFLVIQ